MHREEELNQRLLAIDTAIQDLLSQRQELVRQRIAFCKEEGLPLLPRVEQETDQADAVAAAIRQAEKKTLADALVHKNIALVGFMGAGKSTVSHYLRDALGLKEAETDAMIVESEGMPITEIFAQYGEPYFRSCESQTVINLQSYTQTLISCGGGLVMKDENVENLKKSSYIVLLTATPETTLARVKGSNDRPLLNGHMNVEYIAQLQEKRRAKYQAAADLTVATDGKTVSQICEELIIGLQAL